MNQLMIFILICAVYLFPTIIATGRKHGSMYGIMTMNLLLGWTIIFWLWALIWAGSKK